MRGFLRGTLHEENMVSKIRIDRDEIASFCRRNHIRRLSLFGSVLREDFGPASDVDMLVEFEDGHSPGYLGLAAMEQELAGIVGGRKVDLRTPHELSRYFRDEVVAGAEVQFASG